MATRRDWAIGPAINPNTGEEELNREQLADELLGLLPVLHRLGGAVVIAADRVELAPGVFETVGIRFRWDAYVPGRSTPREEPALEAVPEPEAPELEPAA